MGARRQPRAGHPHQVTSSTNKLNLILDISVNPCFRERSMRSRIGTRPAQFRASSHVHGATSHGGKVQGDSVASVAAFLLDAARGDVSSFTVVQVLQHWFDEGLTSQQINDAVAAADASCAAKHRPTFDSYREPISTRFA